MKPARRVHHLEPSPENLRHIRSLQSWMRPLARVLLHPVVQPSASGVEHLPREGPVLVLANHVSLFDAYLLNAMARREVVLMGTESLMREGLASHFYRSMGMVPKKKATADMRAVRTLKGWMEVGACVGLFPEGQRSWDGRPLPLMPGIEKLIRLFGVPVVTARIHNADHQWPRWAPRPRIGHVHVEFDPPVTFSRQEPLPAIRARVAAGIRVDPDRARRWPVRALRSATGITNLLFACPRCNALDALVEGSRHVRCSACGAAWRVTLDNRLIAEGGEAIPLGAAWDALRDRLAERLDAGVQGPILTAEDVELLDVTDDDPVPRGRGRLVLDAEGFRLEGPESWEAPLPAVQAVTVEQRRRLYVRVGGRTYEPILTSGSVLKWEFVANHLRGEARLGSPEPRDPVREPGRP